MTSTSRRIVLLAPPWYPVPPKGYAGTELVVGLLAEELRREKHEVVLFAAEGSPGAAEPTAPAAWRNDLGGGAERLREMGHAARVLRALERLGRVDVIHDHCGGAMLVGAAFMRIAPLVHTVHGKVDEPQGNAYAELPPSVALVAISAAQRQTAPTLRWAGMVHNAVDVNQLHVGIAQRADPYLLCLARISPEKGQHIAIDVARRTGIRLVLAGKIERKSESREYYEAQIAPHLDGDRIVHIHEVAGNEKARVLAGATALLAPAQWEEPFGLSLVEAMASGTPAIAFPRGAAPELIEPGITGWVVDDIDGMVEAVGKLGSIDPETCATATRKRFSPAAMAQGYLGVYERAIAGAGEDGSSVRRRRGAGVGGAG